MTGDKLDTYLKSYEKVTDVEPSPDFYNQVLSIPEQELQEESKWGLNPLYWVNFMIPRALGWAFTCFLGLYIGLTTADQEMNPVEEELYLYDQAQVIFSEEFNVERVDE